MLQSLAHHRGEVKTAEVLDQLLQPDQTADEKCVVLSPPPYLLPLLLRALLGPTLADLTLASLVA